MFETIYRCFNGLYSSNLAEHLSGWDEATGDYVKTNLFSQIGIFTLAINVLFCVLYYYIINHPRWNRAWVWSLVLLAVSVLSLLIGFIVPFHDVLKENISSDLMPIDWKNCIGFGFANFIVSALIFVMFSFIIKWWSRNCKHSPLF
jgi:uncharacterized BrkB/YihY/UPF0761 family membrane protein